MSLRWWKNSKRSETIQRRSSAVLFRKQAMNGRYYGPLIISHAERERVAD